MIYYKEVCPMEENKVGSGGSSMTELVGGKDGLQFRVIREVLTK